MVRRNTLTRRPAALTALVLALSLVVTTGFAANATIKPRTFTLVVTPGTVAVGSSLSFNAVITNTGTYPLGSVDLKAPSPIVISDTGTTLGSSSFAGHLVHLRDLSLAPGGSFTVIVYATVKCNAYPSLAWSATGRQGNDFTGSTFTLKGAGSSKLLLSTGHCSLRFVAEHQPSDAHPNEHITSSPFNTGGDPVEVEILDGANNRATGISGTIALVIGTNAGPGGILSGSASAPTFAGVASYGTLSIDKTGIGYTLLASSSGLGTATSDPFTIAQLNVDCPANEDCIGGLSDPTTSGQVDAIADPSTPRLMMSLTAGGIDCPDYVEHSSTLEFTVTSTRTKEVTMSFNTGLDPYYVNPDDFQVCFQSLTPFVDVNNESVTLGLLPDCDPYEPVPPCVESRYADGSVVFVTFLAPAGDPKGRV